MGVAAVQQFLVPMLSVRANIAPTAASGIFALVYLSGPLWLWLYGYYYSILREKWSIVLAGCAYTLFGVLIYFTHDYRLAAGGRATLHLADPLPPLAQTVELWGSDPDLARWLASPGATTAPGGPVLLVGRGGGSADAWPALAARISAGATAVFLTPDVFREGDVPLRWLPLSPQGSLAPMRGWLYHQDEWAKAHPIFAGLPAGGLLDPLFYRELLPDRVLRGQSEPAQAVAGACDASFNYSSGLQLGVWPWGAGWVVLNTLLLREHLGHPVADKLIANLLAWAARGE
jgi:hypothetical protein